MRTIPYKENLTVEFKSDLKTYPDNDLIDDFAISFSFKGIQRVSNEQKMKKRLLCIMLAGFMVFANACGNGAAETNGTANSENTGTESPAGGEEMTGAAAESISSADNGQATESTQAAESVQATEFTQATGSTQAAESIQAAESTQAAESIQAAESTQAAESAQATATQSAGGNNQNTQVYVDRPPVDNGQSSQPAATYHYNHPEAANMTLSEICEKEAPYIGDDGMWHTPEDAELWVEDENTRYQEAVDKGWDIPW